MITRLALPKYTDKTKLVSFQLLGSGKHIECHLLLLVVTILMTSILYVDRLNNNNTQILKSWRSENHTPHYYWLNQSK